MKSANGRVLIGDDCGLGKTCQSLSWAKLNDFKKPVLIVVPSTIKIQWRQEFRIWYSKTKNVEILYGRTSYELNKNTSYIINWDILADWTGTIKRWTEKIIDKNTGQYEINPKTGKPKEEKKKKITWNGPLTKIQFDYVIGDEIQSIGNNSSDRTKAFRKITRNSKHFAALSATPITSRTEQFYPILNLLAPNMFNSLFRFQQRYCDPKHNGFGWTYKGASNTKELHSYISKFMIRRKKSEVLKDLPPLQKIIVPLDDISLTSYIRLENKLRKDFRITKDKKKLRDMFDDLKYSAFESKKDSVVKWIETFISSGEKLIVGAYHRKVVEGLHKYFGKQSVIIYGGLSASKKEKAKNDFINDDNVKIIFGNIKSMGTGVDGLQKVCSNVATVEFCWNPTEHEQLEGRSHRSGQESSTNSYYLVAPATVDEELITVLDKKLKMILSVVDGKEPGDMDLLGDLLKLRMEK